MRTKSTVKSISCPKCGFEKVDRLGRRGIIDKIMFWFGRFPYRCRGFNCRKRFYHKKR